MWAALCNGELFFCYIWCMDLFEHYMEEVSKLKNDIPKFAKAILIEHKDVIIGLLQQQLGSGKDSLDRNLEFSQTIGGTDIYGFGEYTKSTERYWANGAFTMKPKRWGHAYNFEWSGDTFEMMDVDIKKDEFDIFSRTGKFNLLKSLYGEEAFELSQEHNEMINEQMLLPLLEEKLYESLALII